MENFSILWIIEETKGCDKWNDEIEMRFEIELTCHMMSFTQHIIVFTNKLIIIQNIQLFTGTQLFSTYTARKAIQMKHFVTRFSH